MAKKQSNDLSSLINQAKQKKVEPKKQKVAPVKESVLKDEKLFSLYMPEDVLIELKIKAAKEKTTLKKLINRAVKEFYGI